jgi:hypothetical protein
MTNLGYATQRLWQKKEPRSRVAFLRNRHWSAPGSSRRVSRPMVHGDGSIPLLAADGLRAAPSPPAAGPFLFLLPMGREAQVQKERVQVQDKTGHWTHHRCVSMSSNVKSYGQQKGTPPASKGAMRTEKAPPPPSLQSQCTGPFLWLPMKKRKKWTDMDKGTPLYAAHARFPPGHLRARATNEEFQSFYSFCKARCRIVTNETILGARAPKPERSQLRGHCFKYLKKTKKRGNRGERAPENKYRKA